MTIAHHKGVLRNSKTEPCPRCGVIHIGSRCAVWSTEVVPSSHNEGAMIGETIVRYRCASDTVNIDGPLPKLQCFRENPEAPGVPCSQLNTFTSSEQVRHRGIAMRRANEIAEELGLGYRVPIVWGFDSGRILRTFESHRPDQHNSYCDLHITTDDYYSTEYIDFSPARSTLIETLHVVGGDYIHFGDVPDMWERISVCGKLATL